jgi:hypothetical protein
MRQRKGAAIRVEEFRNQLIKYNVEIVCAFAELRSTGMDGPPPKNLLTAFPLPVR